ncbi:MAG: hypothetical protein Q9165_002626 [Trypethelium subeluteriae]
MGTPIDKTKRRMSALFSLSGGDPEQKLVIPQENGNKMSAAATSRGRSPVSAYEARASVSKLSKADRRVSSWGHSIAAHTIPRSRTSSMSKRPSLGTINPALDEPLPPPPPILGAAGPGSRASSPARSVAGSGTSSRPTTPHRQHPPSDPQGVPSVSLPIKEEKPKKGLFGRVKNNKKKEEGRGPVAWVIGHDGRVPYDISALINGERVSELWDDNTNTFVYLYPRNSGRGPSFKIDSALYNASPVLARMAFGDLYSSRQADRNQGGRKASQELHSAPATPPRTPSGSQKYGSSSQGSRGSRHVSDMDNEGGDIHLYLPMKLSTDAAVPGAPESRPTPGDIETLVAIRNLFAFLVGQSLVATEKRPTMFAIFMAIADLLTINEFSNIDGSTFGEVAAASFDNYVEELQLADVRYSREKTIEGIVLGERMRSVLLYNEAFVHAIGKYDQIRGMGSPRWNLISPVTRNRMERAAMDLESRTKSIRRRLEDFDFTAIFAGVMNSRVADEGKMVRFDQWKASFFSTRKFVMGYYKSKYGSWPPKASSKKNDLETSGLNRLVLKDIYNDMSALYDLLVDRTNLTTRTADVKPADEIEHDDEPTPRALRRVLAEYDQSTPPVQPPVPFDVPLLPNLSTTRPEYAGLPEKKQQKLRQKKLKDDEIAKLMRVARNQDSLPRLTTTQVDKKKTRTSSSQPFVSAFMHYELKTAHSHNLDEIHSLRAGQWIFMYVVLEALPMLVIDAPAVKHVRAVEYFLCEPPRSGVPWARESATVGTGKRTWYEVRGQSGGGGAVVSLPSDVVEHGVEGVYRRSHCWEMAAKWAAEEGRSELEMASKGVDMHDGEQQPLPSDTLSGGSGVPPPFYQTQAPGHAQSPNRMSGFDFGGYVQGNESTLDLANLPPPPGWDDLSSMPTASSPEAAVVGPRSSSYFPPPGASGSNSPHLSIPPGSTGPPSGSGFSPNPNSRPISQFDPYTRPYSQLDPYSSIAPPPLPPPAAAGAGGAPGLPPFDTPLEVPHAPFAAEEAAYYSGGGGGLGAGGSRSSSPIMRSQSPRGSIAGAGGYRSASPMRVPVPGGGGAMMRGVSPGPPRNMSPGPRAASVYENDGMGGSRRSVVGRSGRDRDSVVMLGLEALPLPQGIAPDGFAGPGSARGSVAGSRPQSSAGLGGAPGVGVGGGGGVGSGGKTFDDILGDQGGKKKKGRK